MYPEVREPRLWRLHSDTTNAAFLRGALEGPRAREALMHCPRLPAVAIARRLERSPYACDRFLRAAGRFDALDRLPTRYVTGYFTAIVAEG